MEKNAENLDRIKSAATIARLAEEDLKDAVTRAFLDGASWAEIGAVLGVSKQTAHNRFRREVEFHEKAEAGALHASAEDQEQFMSVIYNPERRVKVNIKRDYDYRRTFHEA